MEFQKRFHINGAKSETSDTRVVCLKVEFPEMK